MLQGEGQRRSRTAIEEPLQRAKREELAPREGRVEDGFDKGNFFNVTVRNIQHLDIPPLRSLSYSF